MKAWIQSVNADKDTGSFAGNQGIGKETDVESNDFTISDAADGLCIKALSTITHGDGSRGGDEVTVNRRLILTFTTADLLKIMKSPVALKLLAANPVEAPQIAKARQHLEKALKALTVN